MHKKSNIKDDDTDSAHVIRGQRANVKLAKECGIKSKFQFRDGSSIVNMVKWISLNL